VLPRPDSQSFTRFVLSAGVFLVVAAFVLPGLVLRETGVLTISRKDLASYTPTARKELERRQEIAHDAGNAAPVLGAAFLLSGLVLVVLGLPRLRQQEAKAERRSAVEMDKLLAEIRPQSADEREGSVRQEVAEDLGLKLATAAEARSDSPGSSADARGAPPASLSRPVGQRLHEDVRRRVEVEELVLKRIAAIRPPLYELRHQVKMEGAPRLLFDALLVSHEPQRPDIVVEIRVTDKWLPSNARNRFNDALGKLTLYENRTGRRAVGWIVFVANQPPRQADEQRIEDLVKGFGGQVQISVLGPEEVESLTFPSFFYGGYVYEGLAKRLAKRWPFSRSGVSSR
jgi:hypothetical protein